jgi:hypothetical protein
MQMTLTITAESPAEMVTVLSALQGAGVGAPVQLKATETREPKVLGPEVSPELVAGAAVTPVVPKQDVVSAVAEKMADQAAKPRGRPAKTVVEEAATPTAVKPETKLKVVPKKPAPEETKTITLNEVRKALTDYLAANDESKAAELLAKYGKTDRLSKLDPERFEAVYYAAVTPAVVNEFNDDISDIG